MTGRKPAQKGFTLIEILIVLAVISVLTAVALPSYFAYQIKARRVEAILYTNFFHEFQMGHLSSNDEFYTDCKAFPPACTNMIHIVFGSTLDIYNEKIGFGKVTKTPQGYAPLYFFRKINGSDKFNTYWMSLRKNVDNDLWQDSISIKWNSPFFPNKPNGKVFLDYDDLAPP